MLIYTNWRENVGVNKIDAIEHRGEICEQLLWGPMEPPPPWSLKC